MSSPSIEFENFSRAMVGLPVSRVWQGYGSAIFLEFGRLQSALKHDGQPGSPRGEYTLMIEWSWRIEGKRRIWCGSWSDGARWPRVFSRLQGQTVTMVSLFGRLPEIEIRFSNGLHLLSMMTTDSDPGWALIERKDGSSKSIDVVAGRLRFNKGLADETS
jgi:hypothetical protein